MTERELIERLRDALRYCNRCGACDGSGREPFDENESGPCSACSGGGVIPQCEAVAAMLCDADAYLAGTAASAEAEELVACICRDGVMADPIAACPVHGELPSDRDRLAAQLAEARAATRRECAEELRRLGPRAGFGSWLSVGTVLALAARWSSAPTPPAPDPAAPKRPDTDCGGEQHFCTSECEPAPGGEEGGR